MYRDSLGKLTVGVGHLITPKDNLKLGDRISDSKVDEFLAEDCRISLEAAKKQVAMIDVPLTDRMMDTLTEALVYVNFQLGTEWYKIHRNSWSLISQGKFLEASEEIKASLWYIQTPKRVNDFANFLIRVNNE